MAYPYFVLVHFLEHKFFLNDIYIVVGTVRMMSKITKGIKIK